MHDLVSTPVLSLRPVALAAPGRGTDLHVRVSAPATGGELPVIVFSHGFGESMDGYAPLVDFWTAHGFAVVQPTHLDSRTLGLAPDDPSHPGTWRTRIEDLTRVVDQLDVVEAAVPGLAGRLDRTRIAAAGHSWGAQTVSTLLGARVLDADGGPGEDLSDPRISAGVLLAVPGTGGADLTPFAAEHFPFMNPGFARMTTPALVVAGDRDQSALSVRGPEWFTDAYSLSPGPKSLLTLFGAEHSLGGISGYAATETTDESPERVALVQRLTWAFLRSALHPGDTAFSAARAELAQSTDPLGRIESK
ncbi:alpha/beta hydrolase [Actinokineospora sp. PR83]|uniref:alpha/beta hydrolase family protein n=1 Tax=Actinokineospora sp. PR83 TaxID=2884908 RepID=UPI0027DF7D9A|nr:alpha/beta hydrolase [Actinokineospora sp. PR83]MCG8920732.1 alpha/beta hydrolase [Actinokineospora sp. PR83]